MPLQTGFNLLANGFLLFGDRIQITKRQEQPLAIDCPFEVLAVIKAIPLDARPASLAQRLPDIFLSVGSQGCIRLNRS